VQLVNLSRLRRLARAWWKTCAGSSQRTKKIRSRFEGGLMMKKLALAALALALATPASAQ
jgi:hypothetical protein